MFALHPADREAQSARRRLRRRQRKTGRVSQVFETLAALIPTVVMLMHLSLRAAEVNPQADEKRTTTMTAVAEVTPKSPVPIVAVPEPNTAAIVAIGAGMLLMRKRK